MPGTLPKTGVSVNAIGRRIPATSVRQGGRRSGVRRRQRAGGLVGLDLERAGPMGYRSCRGRLATRNQWLWRSIATGQRAWGLETGVLDDGAK